MRTFPTAALALLLCACAANTIPPDFRLGANAKQALLVGSITYDSALGYYSIDASSRDGVLVVAGVGYRMWPPLRPEFDEALKKKGNTFAIPAAPGQYTLQRWNIFQGTRLFAAARPIGITFHAEAGKVTYLGNFHFDKNGEVTLADESARDLPILRTRLGAIDFPAPAYAVAAGTRLERLGETGMQRTNAPVYVPAISASR